MTDRAATRVGRVGGGSGLGCCGSLPAGQWRRAGSRRLAVPGPRGRRPGSRPARPGDERADLRHVGDGSQHARQDLRGLLGDVGDVGVAVQSGQVAGNVEQIMVAPRCCSNRCNRMARARWCSAAGSPTVWRLASGGPRVHRDVLARFEQGKVGQLGGVRPQLRQAGRAVRGGGAGCDRGPGRG
jgi:hypothetical protein